MIKVELVFDGQSMRSFKALGHAVTSEGQLSMVCGAFSLLLKSFSSLMENRDSMQCHLEAPEPGAFGFELIHASEVDLRWYSGVCDMLIQGALALVDQFPEDIELNIRGENHGS